ncbi:MAG: TonB-dependent receptor plug domain-containing protein, partial [Hyphomonadaceae bacterium]
LTLGLKAEDHTFTGLEYMPSVRVAWRPGGEHLVWAAVSRGARTPSRIDRELISPGVVEPGDFQSEYLLAYELGYRTRPTVNSTLSANLYLHEYEGVRTANFTPPGVLPVQIGNGLHGDVYGLEIWGDMDINETWRVSAGATLQEQDLQADPLTVDINGSGLDPEYQVFLRTRHDLTERLDFDLNVRAVGEASPQIPAYAALGARLAYQLNDRAEIALIGENLLDESHLESIDEGRLREARRGVHLSLRMTY